MKRLLLSSLLDNFSIEDEQSRRPITYHVWTNSGGTNQWDQGGNWHNGQVPNVNSQVLLTEFNHSCSITGVVSPIKSLTVWPTFSTHLGIEPEQHLLVREDIRIGGPLFLNIGRAHLITQSGDFIADAEGTIFWANGHVIVSGGNHVIINNFDIYNITGYIAIHSSGTFESNVRLPELRFLGHTTLTGNSNPITYFGLHVSGHLHIPSGNQFTVTSNNGHIQLHGNSQLTGDGVLVLEKGAQFQIQNGEIDCREFIIQDYTNSAALTAGSYNSKTIIFRDSDGTTDSVIFDTGNYTFNGDVEFRSWNSGTLEIANDVNSPNIQFNKNVLLTGTNFSNVTWTRGDGVITLGKATGIEREFTKWREGRGAFNRSDNPVGIAVSRSNFHANLPILWVKDRVNDMSPIGLRGSTPTFHNYGLLQLLGATGLQIADLALGIRPGASGSFIYIADLADTGCNRGGSGSIYRVYEMPVSGLNVITGVWERIFTAFTGAPFGETGGLARDVKAMMVGTGGDMYCITYKTSSPQLFKIPAENTYTGINTWRYMGNLPVDSGIVAADISADGSAAIIKTYNKVYYYTNTTDSIDYMLTGTVPVEVVDYAPEHGEETMAFGSGNQSFYTFATYNQSLHSAASRTPTSVYRKQENIHFNSQSLERLVINSPGHTKVFPVDMLCRSFSLDYGTIHFSGNMLKTESDFYVGPGGDFDYRGLPSSVVDVGGNYLIVGSSGRYINLINYSGQVPAYTRVSGTATVYFARVGGNNASGGATVKAYFSNDHTLNHNWQFFPVNSVSGYRYLYIHQEDWVAADSDLPMNLFGINTDYTSVLYLAMSGADTALMDRSLSLRISGDGNYWGTIPIFMKNEGISSGLPLYMMGTGAPIDNRLYLYIGQSGDGAAYLPLYVAGHLGSTGTMTMIMHGQDVVTSGLNTYIFGIGKEGGKGIKLYSHGRHSSNT